MARTSRQQRRQRRAQQAGTPPLRPAPRPARPAEEEQAPVESAQPRVEREETQSRSGFLAPLHFGQESWAELKKVEWPNQQQVVSGTAVVLVACLITGVFLYLNDQVWRYVVQHLLLR